MEQDMLPLHPEIVKKNGKKQFVLLPYDEYLAIRERLEDADDLLELRRAKAKEGRSPTISLSEVKRRYPAKSRKLSTRSN
jgi:hypothetical protein